MATAKQQPENDFFWAVGLFEGEGSISVRQSKGHGRHYKYVSLQLSSTDHDVIKKFFRVVRIGALCGGKRGYALKHRKRVWKWAVSGVNAEYLCTQFIPYLCTRRKVCAQRVFKEVWLWQIKRRKLKK